jgi:succinoglycan biosynthesis protein ExoM
MRVAICIITRRRPDGLARLLRSLELISVPDGVQVEVVVVENDDPVEKTLPDTSLDLRYAFEPEPGIPAARNRTLDIALADASIDAVAFLDDDETVDPAWLTALLRAHRRTKAAVVTGPANPRLPADAPSWAAASGVFQPPGYPTGTSRPWAFTHNAMIDADVLRTGGFRFDETMRHEGGSDKEFFRRVREAGHDIIWTEEAIAWEWYPLERIRIGWVFQRSYRLGTNAPRTEGRAGARGKIALLLRAARFSARGLFHLVAAAPRPHTALARAAWDFGRAAGLVAGLAGRRYEEYASRHEPS